MKSHQEEIEIKFTVADQRALVRALKSAGFALATPRTFESNILYDFPGRPLRKRGELVRVRQYGDVWTLTYKGRTRPGKHKRRQEIETPLGNGKSMELVLIKLGLTRSFAYQKYRTEWRDGIGQVVIDETPIGVFAEIEGPPRWIDKTAMSLGIERSVYITKTYAALFDDWKRRTRSKAPDMTFGAVSHIG